MLDREILNDFYKESKGLIQELIELLESMEGDFSQLKTLMVYGNKIDRIMGAASSLAMMAQPDHGLNLIADYTSLCKVVAYKSAEVENPEFYDVAVAVLLDATEALKVLIFKIELPIFEMKKAISPNFIERVRWISEQLTKKTQVKSQNEIDDLMKKLGF